ncbi:MAG TPA: DUF4258 domain-containing protein [Gammaproteobacteria bacterium]|nr:DUF4258 domain-containing protein [Gammaproteobacteria bacterium]
MHCKKVLFSRHAITRMFERSLDKDVVLEAIEHGEIIATYPDEQPYPCSLLLWFCDARAVHVVVARDSSDSSCYVVTAYFPSPELWSTDFKTRRTP